MTSDIDPHLKAEILVQALPHMLRYDEATVVVKYGGHAMGDPVLAANFARDIVLIKQAGVNPVVVHGGGPQIGLLLDRLNIRSEFRGGLRVTDRATRDDAEPPFTVARNRLKPADLRTGQLPRMTSLWLSRVPSKSVSNRRYEDSN